VSEGNVGGWSHTQWLRGTQGMESHSVSEGNAWGGSHTQWLRGTQGMESHSVAERNAGDGVTKYLWGQDDAE